MSYVFDPVESRIVDFLLFPLGVNFSKERQQEIESNEKMEYVPAHLEGEWEAIERSLKPFEKRIHKFYFDTYSIPELILKKWSPFSFGSAQAYLQSLLGLEESAIVSCMWDKLNEDAGLPNRSSVEPPFSLGTEEWSRLFEALPIADEEKWRLLNLFQSPKTSLREWTALLQDVEPVFSAYYETKQGAVESLGRRIALELNLSNGEAFGRLTKGLIHSAETLPKRILVSVMEPISIQVAQTWAVPHVKWGLDVEDVLNHVSEQKESELRERVQIFKNLGDSTRYEVLKMIAAGVETAKQIASKLQVSQPTISYHINNLLFAKIIYLDRVGGRYVYKIDEDLLRRACLGLFADLNASVPLEP